MSTTRLEAFSDGVFAVAITLLVIDLHVPAAHDLWRALLAEWPEFASYAVSFLIIGIIWVNHHGVFERIVRIDRVVLFSNLFLLFCVVLIPFATALLAHYIERGTASHIAATAYSLVMLGMAVAFGTIWIYAVRTPGVLDDEIDPRVARASIPRFAGGAIIYLVTVIVAIISAPVCLALHALIALYYVFDHATTSPEAAAQAPTARAT